MSKNKLDKLWQKKVGQKKIRIVYEEKDSLKRERMSLKMFNDRYSYLQTR